MTIYLQYTIQSVRNLYRNPVHILQIDGDLRDTGAHLRQRMNANLD